MTGAGRGGGAQGVDLALGFFCWHRRRHYIQHQTQAPNIGSNSGADVGSDSQHQLTVLLCVVMTHLWRLKKTGGWANGIMGKEQRWSNIFLFFVSPSPVFFVFMPCLIVFVAWRLVKPA